MNRLKKVIIQSAYWLFYISILILILAIMSNVHGTDGPMSYFLKVAFIFVLTPSICCFYLAYTFLFRHYLRHRKVFTTAILSILGIIFISLLCSLLLSLVLGQDFMFKNGCRSFLSEFLLLSCFGLVNILTGFILKGFISWYEDLREKESLQKLTLELELKLIKSKLDPHFLFNTINNIDGMMLTDVDKASAYLDKLSSILRFMLYKTNEGYIPISEEIQYIEKYIELQKIRTSNQEYVRFVVEGVEHQHNVPPMLFIPFIENAFKHVGSRKAKYAIDIRFDITESQLVFFCKNVTSPDKKSAQDTKGIGNKSIEKRLNLLYPDNHTLEINEKPDSYTVQLIITNR